MTAIVWLFSVEPIRGNGHSGHLIDEILSTGQTVVELDNGMRVGVTSEEVHFLEGRPWR